MGRSPHPPKTKVSAAFANGNRASMTPAPTAVTWPRGFNDPLLKGLGAQAATNNPDVRSAKSSLAAAVGAR